MILSTNNGWDPLKEVIVGDVTGARIPPLNLSMKNFMFANLSDSEIVSICKPWIYPDRVIKETEEDLDLLAKTLNDLHIRVYRPEKRVYGWMNYCPRDIFLVLNDTIIETPCVMSERINESFAYKHILDNIDSYGKWIQAPTPQYLDMSFCFNDLSKPTLMDIEIMFDAPNVVRLGKDLLYQVSNSGNIKGHDWLKRTFPEYTIHLAYQYSGAHFDSTVIPLRPGLVLLNGHRCSKDNYPEIFKKWDKIFFTDIIDQYSENSAISSSAIGLNILSINERVVIVDRNQTPLIKELKKYNIDSIPMSLRHAKTLGGGFHCVTLDLYREGKLEQYDF
jgi:glycine amidinotransferase/scyllo-inosamine-4-phosphate amidinotransferase 1